MSHADSFLSTASAEDVLGSRLFGKCDVLLCCSERFYEVAVKYRNYATHVVRLEPWGRAIQDRYADALFPEGGREDLESWRDADEVRGELCEVPFHLTYLLPRMRVGSPGREQIEARWRVFELLAWERHSAAQLPGAVEDWMAELGTVAHRFYEEHTPLGPQVGFRLDELRDFLRERSSSNLRFRMEKILGDTLIAEPSTRAPVHHFERPIWGLFFTAWHLANVIRLNLPEASVLEAFGKAHSPRDTHRRSSSSARKY
jgi:hypothetical protein